MTLLERLEAKKKESEQLKKKFNMLTQAANEVGEQGMKVDGQVILLQQMVQEEELAKKKKDNK